MIEPNGATGTWEDPVVAEVRRARDLLFASADDDLDKLCELLRDSERESEERLVRLAPRPAERLPDAP